VSLSSPPSVSSRPAAPAPAGTGAAPGGEAQRPPLFEYSLSEREESLGPAGERIRALSGRAVVQGGRARWTLAASRFPRSRATEAILDGRGRLALVDASAREVASGSASDFPALFRAPVAEEAAGTPLRDVDVRVTRSGEGRPFQGEPTVRWTLRGSWVLSLLVTGRVSSVRTTAEGTVESVEAPGAFDGARSGLDDLLRLLPARGAAAEAIAREVEKIGGFPVRVRAVFTSEESGEQLTPRPGAEGATMPLRIRTETSREVTDLVRREGRPGDEALFSLPEDFRSRPVERLLPAPEGPR